MGANTFLESVVGYGYDTEAAATVIQRNIPGRSGERIAIRGYSFGCGGTATNATFLQVQGTTTLAAVAAAGASTLTLTAAMPAAYIVTALDWVCIVQDDGTYHFSKIGAVATSVAITLCTVTTVAAAIGNAFYQMGVAADEGQYLIKLTITTGDHLELDGGILYAPGKGYPMIAQHANDAAAAGSIRYIMVDYLNV
jgi:hypothetical protein